jgi:hypothetical protein
MISQENKEALRDLIQREQISDILQVMLSEAGKEAARLQNVGVTRDQSMSPALRSQAMDAIGIAQEKADILRVAVQEATSVEMRLGIHTRVLANATQLQLPLA